MRVPRFSLAKPAPRSVLSLLALLCLLGCGPSGDEHSSTGASPSPRVTGPTSPTPRHLVLISIDTLRADRLGCYGCPRPTSPDIDAFARRSLLFRDATSAATNTAPSHMSMFTGLRPPVHGVFNVGAQHEKGHAASTLSPAMTTLAQHLSAAGFATSAFTDGGYLTPEMQFDRGFDRFVRNPQRVDRKVDEVLAFLDDADRSRRQFLFVHTYEVHAPYIPPPEHDLFSDPDYDGPLRAKLDALRDSKQHIGPALAASFLPPRKEASPEDVAFLSGLYDGGVHFTDAEIGRLLERLLAPPWSEDTAVILLSDHGEAFLEHGALAHAEVHRNVTHVPLIVHLPGGPTGERTDPAAGVDVAPTVLDILGLPLPEICDGVSLFASPRADRLIASYNNDLFQGGGLSLRREDHEIARNWQALPWQAFDLSSDPDEQRPLPLEDQPATALQALADKLSEQQHQLAAALGRGDGDAPELSPETLEQLKALGYLGDG